jgi:hypothetical protein
MIAPFPTSSGSSLTRRRTPNYIYHYESISELQTTPKSPLLAKERVG